MQKPFKVLFFLYDRSTPVSYRNKQWKLPLPQTPGPSDTLSVSAKPVTYGDYFKAVKTYLENDRFEALLYGLFCLKHEKKYLQDIEEIGVILSKHGEFYHPSKIEVSCQGENYSLVLNVAVSSPGKSVIKQEIGVLDELGGLFSHKYLPQVYGFGRSLIGKTRIAYLFLGQWFEGYHEFHASKERTGKIRIHLWDTENGYVGLSDEDAFETYRKIAKILTAFYNVHTFKQIFPWHHAAGDFILRKDPHGIDVKLITVRQYEAMIEAPDPEDSNFQNVALLLFLLNLSIRMRLDRLDGTGEVVWLDDFLVESTVSGFFEGLDEQMGNGLLTGNFLESFKTYIQTRDRNEFIETGMAIVDAYHPKAPELSLIKEGIQRHLAMVIDVLGKTNLLY